MEWWALRRLKQYIRQITAGTFARGVSTLIGGTAIGQLAVVLAAPLLTRLYSPGDFGMLAVFTSIIGILSAVVSLRYNAAIPLPKSHSTATSLLVASLLTVLSISSLLTVLLWVWGGPLLTLLNAVDLLPYIYLISVATALIGIYNALIAWATRIQAYSVIARTRINQGLTSTGIQILFGLLGIKPLGLLLGQIVGSSTGIRVLGANAWRSANQEFRQLTYSAILTGIKRYRYFSLYSTWATLLNRAGNVAPSIALAMIYGAEAAGWYAIGDRIMKTPLYLLGRAVAQVYLGETATLMGIDVARVKSLFYKTSKVLIVVGLIPLGAALILGPLLFELILGPEWREAGRIVQILAVVYFAQFVMNPLLNTLVIMERQKIQALYDFLRVLGICVAFVTSSIIQLDMYYALTAYAVVELAYHAALYYVTRKGVDGLQSANRAHSEA